MALNNASNMKQYTSSVTTPTKTATLSTADRVAQMQKEYDARNAARTTTTTPTTARLSAQQASTPVAAQTAAKTTAATPTAAKTATATPTTAKAATTKTATTAKPVVAQTATAAPTTNARLQVQQTATPTATAAKTATPVAAANPTTASKVTQMQASASPAVVAASNAAKAATATPKTTAEKVAQMQKELAARQANPAASIRTATASTAAAPLAEANSSTLMPSSVADTTVNLDEPVTETAPAATTAPVSTSNTSSSTTVNNTFTPATYTPTGIYAPGAVEAYNEQRQADLRALYDQALQNTLNGMRTAYDQNMSDAAAARDQISPQYQRSMSALGAEYERQRRNNNMQAAANGLNTGAGSQMALAQSANYQANQAGLSARENEALNEANRRIGDLQRNYQNAIAEATANNNYKLAAAMMEEYQNAYKRQMDIENTNYQRAQQLDQQNYTRSWNEDERTYSRGVDEANRKAQYGDFSGYRDLYGDDTARLMEQTWAMQNPYQAWASGKLSAADFYALTGKLPADPNSVAGQLPGGGEVYTGLNPEAEAAVPSYLDVYGNYSNGLKRTDSLAGLDPTKGAAALRQNNTSARRYYSSGGGGYSSSRDTAYRGAPGYLTEDGRFVTGFDNDSGTPHSQKDYDRANTFADVYSQTGSLRDANIAAYQGGSNNSGNGGGNDSGNNNSGGNNTDTGNNWTREDNGNSSVVDAAVGWLKNLFS